MIQILEYATQLFRGSVAEWMPVSREFSPINGSRCFLEQETLPLLLSTGWLQERNRAWFTKDCLCHNRTNINWYKTTVIIYVNIGSSFQR